MHVTIWAEWVQHLRLFAALGAALSRSLEEPMLA